MFNKIQQISGPKFRFAASHYKKMFAKSVETAQFLITKVAPFKISKPNSMEVNKINLFLF